MAGNAARNRDAALLVEAAFGERIPECRRCRSHDMFNEYARAAMRCGSCGWLEANEQVLMVPKDERVREALGL